MNDLLAEQNRELRQEVANLRLELEAARAALAAERDAHQVTLLKLEEAEALHVAVAGHEELITIWRKQDELEAADLLDRQALHESIARGESRFDEPTRRERPYVPERTTVVIGRETMRELVFGGGRG